MVLNIPAVLKRHLRKTESFHEPAVGSTLPVGFERPTDEVVIGWYLNPPDGPTVVFTEVAIYIVSDGRIERIALSELLDYDLPDSKRATPGVTVQTLKGPRFIPIAGMHGRYSDAWCLVRALNILVGSERNE